MKKFVVFLRSNRKKSINKKRMIYTASFIKEAVYVLEKEI